MDPEACWDALCGALIDGEGDLAADAAEDLADWIAKGGHLPAYLRCTTGIR